MKPHPRRIGIRPGKEDLIAVAIEAGLHKKEAEEVFERMQEIVKKPA